jgi:DNA primase
MALPGGFLDELRARTPLAPLIGRRIKLERAGNRWKACCPFHGEKTPSFHIWDDHYHCFGCGAHGDAVSFVMQTDGAGFMEAVNRLAAEAGLEVPALSSALAEAERRRHTLGSVLEMAAASFHRRLWLPEGRAALGYLRGRGLTDETIRRFGLGWSGEARGALMADLGRQGIEPELLIDAGLMRRDTETGRTYELFYNRVMFPIRNRRGGVISFGGRILGDGQPKYVNGPETALFAKRRSLYGLDLAREAMRAPGGKAEIVVVEGYMDVIALNQAGFSGAVAPLGTALTEDQLTELWRLSPVPALCFDGDAAGRRAAARAADLALPLLAPDRTLRLATLPENEDPDTLVGRSGSAGFQSVLNAARPLADALFDLIRDGTGDKSPEQRAQLRHRLEGAAQRIADRALAREYRSVLLDRFFADRRGRTRAAPARALPRPQPSGIATAHERARILTAVLLRHPSLLVEVGHAFATLELPLTCDRVRKVLLNWSDQADVLDSRGLIDHLTDSGLADDAMRVLAAEPVPLPGFALAEATPGDAEEGWWHIYSLMQRDRLEQDVATAQREFQARVDADSQRRLIALRTDLVSIQCGEDQGEAKA